MADDLPAPDDPCWRRVRPRPADSDLDRSPLGGEGLLIPLLPVATWQARVPYAFAAAVGWFLVFPVLLGGQFGMGVALLAGMVSTWVLVGRRAPLEVEGYVLGIVTPVLVVLLLTT